MVANCTVQDPQETYKLNSILKVGIRIYTGTFRTSPIESLHAEAHDSTMELRKNELGPRFLHKLSSNTTYTVSLNTLEDREGQDYKGNEGTTKPTRVHLKKTGTKIYERAERGGRGPPGTTTLLINKQCTLLL